MAPQKQAEGHIWAYKGITETISDEKKQGLLRVIRRPTGRSADLQYQQPAEAEILATGDRRTIIICRMDLEGFVPAADQI